MSVERDPWGDFQPVPSDAGMATPPAPVPAKPLSLLALSPYGDMWGGMRPAGNPWNTPIPASDRFDDHISYGPAVRSDALPSPKPALVPATFDERFGNGPMSSDEVPAIPRTALYGSAPSRIAPQSGEAWGVSPARNSSDRSVPRLAALAPPSNASSIVNQALSPGSGYTSGSTNGVPTAGYWASSVSAASDPSETRTATPFAEAAGRMASVADASNRPASRKGGKPKMQLEPSAEQANLFAEKEQQYELPQGYLTHMARIESHFNPSAKNPRSSAGGLFQFTNKTAQQYRLTDRFDPVASTDAAARLAVDNMKVLRRVLGRDPTAGELYLAHQQGAGGASKLLRNSNARAIDVVGEKAVRLNGGNADMTAGEFASKWISKVDLKEN